MSDLEARIAEVLAHNRCRQNNPKADHPIWGYLTFSEDQREFLRGAQAQAVTELMPLIREAQAEAWQEGHQSGWEEHENPGPFVNDYWDSKLPNPYRRSNDE